MKKTLSFVAVVVMTIVVLSSAALAAAQLPSTSVWFAPADAVVGAPITLNVLVYNNQASAATITVAFTADTQTKIGSVIQAVPSETAKTFSVVWKMPGKNAVVTGTVITALNSSKKSVPALLGPIGSVTVGTVTPLITGVSVPAFPGSAQIVQWFTPLIRVLEKFRLQQATYFTDLEDSSRAKIGINPAALPQVFQQPDGTPATTTPISANTANILGNPMDYLTYAYAAAFAALFTSQMVFYIVLILIVLLVLRFIANRIF